MGYVVLYCFGVGGDDGGGVGLVFFGVLVVLGGYLVVRGGSVF